MVALLIFFFLVQTGRLRPAAALKPEHSWKLTPENKITVMPAWVVLDLGHKRIIPFKFLNGPGLQSIGPNSVCGSCEVINDAYA
ncbi:MAG: hypothetical protein ACQERT_16265, partial [Thermodesulfobacteriota bacterium]